MASIKFSDIKEGSSFELEEKAYPFVMQAQLNTTPGGFKCIEITYTHLGTPEFDIKFDKCIYGTATKEFDQTVPAVKFGLNKLKHLNEATVNLEDLDPAILVKVLNNKKVIAKIKKGAKYYEIDGVDAFTKYIEPTTSDTSLNTAAPVTFEVDDMDDPFKE